ncbi:hypothetical protein [Agrobacterium sp. NPDC089420]|uniref:hypothetical protein n=1 Tax=Agrobacterium sp. NPDC089420 TaxID=3363918 RepID=UPI00384B9FC7
MSGYALDIQIDNAGLETISSAKMSVALLKPQPSSDYQIVTLLMSAANNLQVGWSDTQLVYSSSYLLQPYTVLKINSQATALPGQTFDFNGSMISQSGTNNLPDTVQLSNSSQSTIVSGLARVFSINGAQQAPAILSAASILPYGLGSFEIGNAIMLTLLSGAEAGLVIPSQVLPNYAAGARKAQSSSQIAAQPPLILDFSSSNAAQTVHFDDQSNMFVAGGLPS